MSNPASRIQLSYRQRLNIYRRYFNWKSSNIIYIHNPKSAGTSISYALYGRTLGHYPADYIMRKFPKLFASCFTFTIVRNPWSRTLSAYKFAKMGSTLEMGMKNPQRYRSGYFDSFERFLTEWLIEREVSKEDFVFQPQTNFICDPAGDILVDYVGKIENLRFHLGEIEKLSGIELDPRKLNSTSEELDYRTSYQSEDMIRVVESIYRSDIETFNYRFEDD